MLPRRTLLLAPLAALVGCGIGQAASSDYTIHRLTSTARGRKVAWSLIRPPGDGVFTAVIALHGLGQDHTITRSLGAGRLIPERHRFAIAAPDGGTSYWHPHRGEDAGAMVTDELLPRLADLGLRTDRIGLLGWSMGGYGALRLAGLLGPGRVAAVAAVSPALWVDGADASASGFDDAAEYARYSVLGRQHDLAGIPIRIDCGADDPFAAAVRTYRAGFATAPAGRFSPGGHDRDYWRRVLPGELRWLGSRLAA
ncbi:alpha/beta hydrolase [Nocardioides sp.]|uniref:alpha/beta hydrolase n=1 Tax=Nocardioides sp. TaxID=35761 RepID=UPI0039E6FFFC